MTTRVGEITLETRGVGFVMSSCVTEIYALHKSCMWWSSDGLTG